MTTATSTTPVLSALLFALSSSTGAAGSSAAVPEASDTRVSTKSPRSSWRDLLVQPDVKLSLCDRAFTSSALYNWKKLPYELKAVPLVTVFKKQLKTYRFSLSLSDCRGVLNYAILL